MSKLPKLTLPDLSISSRFDNLRPITEYLVLDDLDDKHKRVDIDADSDTQDNQLRLPITVVGAGQPMLLVHAFGMDARQFLPFVLPLCDQYQFYLPHMRGFGLAHNIPVGQFNFIEQYASDIEQIIDHINQQHDTTQIPVAAISMGALVMWAYFSRFGGTIENSKVSRYLNIDQLPIIHSQPDWGGLYGEDQDEWLEKFWMVLDTTLPFVESDIQDYSHLPFYIKQSIKAMEYDFSLTSVSRWPTQQATKLLRYQPAYKLALNQHDTWRHKLRALHAYATLPYDYRAALDKVTIPVTVLIGERSQLYDIKEQLAVADRLANGKAIVVENSGHAMPIDAPIAFYRELKAFLTANKQIE